MAAFLFARALHKTEEFRLAPNVDGLGAFDDLVLRYRLREQPDVWKTCLTLILPRSRTGTLWFYTSTSNKRAARTKLYTESLTRDLKLMYSRFTLVRISINFNSSQLNMFREIILPIFRSTRLCVTACGVMHTPRCCRPSAVQFWSCCSLVAGRSVEPYRSRTGTR